MILCEKRDCKSERARLEERASQVDWMESLGRPLKPQASWAKSVYLSWRWQGSHFYLSGQSDTANQ